MPVYHATKTGKLIRCDVTLCRTKNRLHVIAPENMKTINDFISYSEQNLPELLYVKPVPVVNEPTQLTVNTTVTLEKVNVNPVNRTKVQRFLAFLSYKDKNVLTYTETETGYNDIKYVASLPDVIKFLKFFDTLT